MSSHTYSTSFRTLDSRVFLDFSAAAMEQITQSGSSELEVLLRWSRAAQALCLELLSDHPPTRISVDADVDRLLVRIELENCSHGPAKH